ncbi:MAG: hypothetical protein AAGA87_12655 [Pseudomonadota bacterium]
MSLAFIALAGLAIVECVALLIVRPGGLSGDTTLILVLAMIGPLGLRALRFRRFPSLFENAVACAVFLVVLFALATQPESAFPGAEADYRRMIFGVGGAILSYFVILGYRFILRGARRS